jgi:hypothetical protein
MAGMGWVTCLTTQQQACTHLPMAWCHSMAWDPMGLACMVWQQQQACRAPAAATSTSSSSTQAAAALLERAAAAGAGAGAAAAEAAAVAQAAVAKLPAAAVSSSSRQRHMQRALQAPARVLAALLQVLVATMGAAGWHLTQQLRGPALAVLLAARAAAAASRRQACRLLLAAVHQQQQQQQAGLVVLWSCRTPLQGSVLQQQQGLRLRWQWGLA